MLLAQTNKFEETLTKTFEKRNRKLVIRSHGKSI